MANDWKAWARACKMDARYWAAGVRAAMGGGDARYHRPVFLIGCGRSGTTMLGRLLGSHASVSYRFEPYHLWAAVDSITDGSNLFGSGCGQMILRRTDCKPRSRQRFFRLFQPRKGNIFIEKTPHNALRIVYLEKLAPGARFIHIVRDGIDVCASIQRVASANKYQLARRRNYNAWWGVDDHKWRVLSEAGKRAGYFVEEVDSLSSHAERGAYEWLVSLGEVDRARTGLGDRLLEVVYERFTVDPRGQMREICAFLGLSAEREWLDQVAEEVDSGRNSEVAAPKLPPKMENAFSCHRQRFGFMGRYTAVA